MAHHSRSDTSFAAQLDAAIARNGFAVVPVGYGVCSIPSCCGPAAPHPWTYTVGLSQIGQPELVLMGLDPMSAHFALASVAHEALMGRGVPADEPFEVRGAGTKLVAVPDEWVLTDPDRMAAWFDERERHSRASGLPRLLQLVWADAFGVYPDDPSCRPAVAQQQPVLRDDPFSIPHRAPRTVRRPNKANRAPRRVA